LPEVTQLARDLRELSVSLKSVTDKVDQGGIGSVVNAPALPDYQPGSRKQK
jgi:phospholipid/cholesterol/gamma-HCH transport system substrate-binding protein